MTKYFLYLSILLVSFQALGQNGRLMGAVLDQNNHEPLPYASISVNDDESVFNADENGYFDFQIATGYYKLKISYLSYDALIIHQVKSDPISPTIINVELLQKSTNMSEVTITSDISNRTSETPLSIKSIGINEITRFPGTTLDVSKIIKTLPGVLPKVSFGYNIIVRGGASHENKFYIDGIEIPSINHFSVQGVSGGPNGLINVDLLRGASLITGAFPANRYNALSSVLDLNTRSARTDRIGGKFTLGATDVGLSLEGPINQTTSFILSTRKSFSEYYLKAFKLPILPAYTDYNFKIESKWDRNELKVIGIGAFDKSRLNLEDANSPDASDKLLYNTGYIPEGDQTVHTIGLNYKKYSDAGYLNVILGTSYFRNQATKYFDNTFDAKDLWLNYDSKEWNTKLRIENNLLAGVNKIKFGFSAENLKMNMSNYSVDVDPSNQKIINNFQSELNLINYGGFISWNRKFFNDKLDVFTGLRTDASNYGSLTDNLLNQISPRISVKYKLSQKSDISANIGSYYQLPPSILMSFSENDELVNKNKLGYINSKQIALGYGYQINEDRFFTIEGFYKKYSDYPFLLRDSISFANANAEYVVVGNQKAESISKGRAYGIEFFIQQKFTKKTLWTASYTYSVSEFQDNTNQYISSSWDTRHFMNLVWSRTLRNNWQIGAKFTYASSSPYTPFDEYKSSEIAFWDNNRRGIFDYNKLNSAYLKPFQQLDLRVDKNYYFSKWTMNLYLDIQNFYSASIEFIPYLIPQRGENGIYLVDPNDSSRYLTEIITSDSGRVLPTIGIIAEF